MAVLSLSAVEALMVEIWEMGFSWGGGGGGGGGGTSSTQDVTYALRKVHPHSILFLTSSPNAAFETVPMLV